MGLDQQESLFANRQGEPITAAQWTELHHNPDYVTIGRDFAGDMLILTVWQGIVVNPAWIFETAIFAPEECGGGLLYQVWTATEAAARAAHDQAVSFAREVAELAAEGRLGEAELELRERLMMSSTWVRDVRELTGD